ncbi:MAG: isoprenylcysteine carboxylmethyltransferase family protein [Caldisericia bacterium]|nr:isoprenylcysteine carboxylmethyltransferase family protein [Caldisericia bacterium]
MERFSKQLIPAWLSPLLAYYLLLPAILWTVTWLIKQILAEPPINFGWVNWVVGLVILAPNLAISVWSLATLLGHRADRLVVTGPYAHSRNPLPASMLGVYWGVGILIGSLIFIIAASFVFAVIALYIILFGEKKLCDRFGREYLLYRQRTPFMIPRVTNRRDE